MKNRKIVFDFGSTNISVFSDGVLLLRVPAVLIMRRSLNSSVVFYGKEAIVKKEQASGDEFMWIRPIQKGAIAHYEGARLLVKEILQNLFGLNKGMEICVLISCGLEIEQKKDIEKLFVTNGYSNVYLMESILALSPILDKVGANVVCILGGDLVDVGVLMPNSDKGYREYKIISGYSLDLGGNLINERIKKNIEQEYKLQISDEDIEEIKIKVGSLFANDMSSYSCTGLDIISGKKKKITITNREIYKSITFIFQRIIKLIDGVLLVAPKNILDNILEKGIVFAGGGAAVTGLEEFIYQNLTLPCFIDKKPYLTHLKSAYELIKDEIYMENYLKD